MLEFDTDELWRLLKEKKVAISRLEVDKFIGLVDRADTLIPTHQQLASLIQLLNTYEHTKKKVIIQLEEIGEKKIPITITLAVLAEDWRGMANSIVGIIHQKEGNILYLKALTVPYEGRLVAVVLLAFELRTPEEYNRYLAERNNLVLLIREASLGSQSKTMLLEDETVKFELYNQTINRIKKIYKQPDIDSLINENGETLKFFSSRSREYLEERKISDLADIIIDNYRFQQLVHEGKTDKKIKVKNIETQFEHLTGITFVCPKDIFSVENFLKTLEFIVPGHVIKYHKSFVNQHGILVYRIEIVDSEEQPLNPQMIKIIENSLQKMISSTADEHFCQVKTIGGFENYARAIIPFLMEELQQTNLTQVYLSADKKNEFLIEMKLIVVTYNSAQNNLNLLIRRMEKLKGVEIFSVTPPRTYKARIGVHILNLKISIPEFPSIVAIFTDIKKTLRKTYGPIRDFDEGLREKDLKNLSELKERLKRIQPQLLREIYYNFDEIYRIETAVPVLAEIIRLGCQTIKIVDQYAAKDLILTYRKIIDPSLGRPIKTVFVLSAVKAKSLLSSFIAHFKNTEIYFTRFEWKHRVFLILTLKKSNQALPEEDISEILSYIRSRHPRHLIIEDNVSDPDTC